MRPSHVVTTVVVAVGFLGLFSGALSQYLARPVYEVAIAGTTVLSLRGRFGFGNLLVVVALAGYVAVGFVIAIGYQGASVTDFLIAYKAFAYLPALYLVSGREVFRAEDVVRTYKVLLFLFFVGYGGENLLHLVTTGEFGRPSLFAENNFELLLLMLLHLFSHERLDRTRHLYTALLLVVVLLSGSRSGIVTYATMFVVLYLRADKRLLLAAVGLPIVLYLTTQLFLSRLEGQVTEIDRVIFLGLFLEEVRAWQWWHYLFGTMPVTPLSPSTCTALSFYEDLFSDTGRNLCYSVALHAYILRVVFDHGVVGASVLGVVIFRGLRRGGLDMRTSMGAIGMLVVNSLSVSSANSAFVMLALMMISSTRENREQAERADIPLNPAPMAVK